MLVARYSLFEDVDPLGKGTPKSASTSYFGPKVASALFLMV